MITIHPTSPWSLVGYQDQIRSGLEEIASHSPHIVEVESELRNMAQGQYVVWIALDDGKYAGFAATAPYVAGSNKFTNVVFAHVLPGHRGVLEEMTEAFADYATSLGHYGVTFRTARNAKAWQRALGERWQPHLSEFILRI